MVEVKRFLGIFLTLILSGIFTLHSGEVAASQTDSVLASVNGRAITLVDVLLLTGAQEMQAASLYSGTRLHEEIRRYRREAVDDLIDNILIQAEFAKYGFTLPSQDVEREIDQIATRIGCHSRSDLERRLRREGSSIEEVRLKIRNNMMVQLMLYRQIRIAEPVSPREVYEYYQANQSTFSTPEKVTLAMLKVPSSCPDLENEAVRIGEILKNDPAEFAGLVRRYSPELGNGDLGEIECRLLRPEFAAAFTQFETGMIVGPIRIYDGLVWLKVISYSPETVMPFATVEERIKVELEQRKREQVIRTYAARLRSKAIIEYYF
ncbi:MAG: hypothetical protein E7053_07250 [Lentisphaerae bacterium]|nr:hypothetical protein [Lentisphaerota bacterium]